MNKIVKLDTVMMDDSKEKPKIDTSKQTPIEIALGIDEYGMTTARRLYAFLELDPTHYAKWFRKNITGNEFADKDVDFKVLALKCENPKGGRPTQDAKLSAGFAKKLSMMSKSEKGEQAREYFIKVEDVLRSQAQKRFQKPDSYMIDDRIERAKRWIEEEQERVELREKNVELVAENASMKPKAQFYDLVMSSTDCITIEEMAKLLNTPEAPLGRNRLYKWLQEKKFLKKDRLPYQKYISQGYFTLHEYTYHDKTYHQPRICTQARITPLGQNVIARKWADAHGWLYA